jgi:hypothetical protein
MGPQATLWELAHLVLRSQIWLAKALLSASSFFLWCKVPNSGNCFVVCFVIAAPHKKDGHGNHHICFQSLCNSHETLYITLNWKGILSILFASVVTM